MSVRPGVSGRAEELLMRFADANYECGEHDGARDDEPYAAVHGRAIKAEESLRRYIRQLEKKAGA